MNSSVAKRTLGLVFGVAGLAAGTTFYVIKTKNDNPARWYRMTHPEATATLLDVTPPFQFSACAIQGKREYMEDRCFCAPVLPVPVGLTFPANSAVSCFGIFDGHGGSVSSSFAVQATPIALAKKMASRTFSLPHVSEV